MTNNEFLIFILTGLVCSVRLYFYYKAPNQIIYKLRKCILFFEIAGLFLNATNLINNITPTSSLIFFLAIFGLIFYLIKLKDAKLALGIKTNILKYHFLIIYNRDVLSNIFKLKNINKETIKKIIKTDQKNVFKAIKKIDSNNIDEYINETINKLKKFKIIFTDEDNNRIKTFKKEAYEVYISNISKLKNWKKVENTSWDLLNYIEMCYIM